MLFDKFQSRVIIEGKIVALKGIHIGTGQNSISPLQVDSAVLKDVKRNPIIPGSSLKGVLRSRVEAILSNTQLSGRWTSCNILSDNDCCIQDSWVKQLKESNKTSREIAEAIYEKSCDVCRLFGSKHMAAKLQIKDMNCIKFIGYERRDGVGIDRDSGTAHRTAKYDFEIAPAGTTFDFYAVAENIDSKQKQLLDFIIKLLKDGEISVGGMVSRGLGQIALKDEKITYIDRDNIAEYYGLA